MRILPESGVVMNKLRYAHLRSASQAVRSIHIMRLHQSVCAVKHTSSQPQGTRGIRETRRAGQDLAGHATSVSCNVALLPAPGHVEVVLGLIARMQKAVGEDALHTNFQFMAAP